MTDHNHALNRTLAHLIKGGTLTTPDAVDLVHQVREEGRALAWDSAEARVVAADAQSWQFLRAKLLELVDDPFIWDDGASEAEVLSRWVQQLAARTQDRGDALKGDGEATQPMVTLDPTVARPRRSCGGNGGRAHEAHLWDRAGEAYFCPGEATVAAIPHQADHADE